MHKSIINRIALCIIFQKNWKIYLYILLIITINLIYLKILKENFKLNIKFKKRIKEEALDNDNEFLFF